MTLFVGGFYWRQRLLPTGQLMAKGKLRISISSIWGLQFSYVYGHLAAGRAWMMVGEINGSFKGWQDRLFLTLYRLWMLLGDTKRRTCWDSSFVPFGTIFPWAFCRSSIALLYCPALFRSSFRRSHRRISQPNGISFRYYLYFPVRGLFRLRYGMAIFNRAGKRRRGLDGNI